MELHGKNIIAGGFTDTAVVPNAHQDTFTARGNLAGFEEATEQQIDLAFDAAAKAFAEFRQVSAEDRAKFLERIGFEIEALGDQLLVTASTETGLPISERLQGERGRTVNQLRMFAALIREGSWVDARIDRATPERKPVPKPDVRRMLIPLGPIAVFSASNFPLAFSVAGGDTASAFAAGCPVVVKAHPAHPATSELVGRAITNAVRETGLPAGIFSLLHSTRHTIATTVVQHPLATAVGFTGSLRAGRALFDAAADRPDPIPVYAEMGSTNPVFVLPGALRERAEAIAQGMKASIMLGVGQFCTCPGVAVGIADPHFGRFTQALQEQMTSAAPGTMLYEGILRSYEAGVKRLQAVEGVATIQSAATADHNKAEARPSLFVTDSDTFANHRELSEEVFGPSAVVIRCNSRADMIALARNLGGHLTATIHGTPEDLAEHQDLVSVLVNKVGRLIFNGFPTGVEVCAAMHHGGPYPATTDSKTTSVGTAAILRFARPVAYQNFPQHSLPLELQDSNPCGIWRLVDGRWTKEAIL